VTRLAPIVAWGLALLVACGGGTESKSIAELQDPNTCM
jgi:hypothetical protein